MTGVSQIFSLLDFDGRLGHKIVYFHGYLPLVLSFVQHSHVVVTSVLFRDIIDTKCTICFVKIDPVFKYRLEDSFFTIREVL